MEARSPPQDVGDRTQGTGDETAGMQARQLSSPLDLSYRAEKGNLNGASKLGFRATIIARIMHVSAQPELVFFATAIIVGAFVVENTVD